MKKIRHFESLKNLIDRHPEWRLYHCSIGSVLACNADGYARAHDKPVTVSYNEERDTWEIVKW